MRITSKGQVTLPAAIRSQAGLLPHTEVEFLLRDGVVIVRKAHGNQARGKRLIQGLRGKARTELSTEQIMALTRGEEG